MRVRVLYGRRMYPEYEVGQSYDMPEVVAQEFVRSLAGEPVGPAPVERAVAPPPDERKVEVELPEWPLKTKTPEDYIAEHGDKSEDDLAPATAANLELARRIVGA